MSFSPTSLTTKVVFFQSSGNFQINMPSNFYSLTSIEAIGGGGTGAATARAGGGGGGAYAKSTSVTGLSPNSIAWINVGAIATDTWFNNVSNAAPTLTSQGVLAKGGATSSSSVGGAGGAAASCVGDVTFSGGTGGSSPVSNLNGGGGGSAGPGGAGGNGGAGYSVSAPGGSGGGGSSATATVAGTAGGNGTATAGGNGGASTGQTGGAGATAASPVTGGTNGGGGGGGFFTTNGPGFSGSVSPTIWTTTTGWDNGYYDFVTTFSIGGGGGGGIESGAGGGGGAALAKGGGGGGGEGTGIGVAGLLILTYQAAIPTISSISPTSGYDGGGNTVTINGTNLGTATSVLFGTQSVSFTLVSDTQITLVVPSIVGLNLTTTPTITVTTPYGSASYSSYTYVETSQFTTLGGAITTAPQIGELIYGLTSDSSKYLNDGYLAPDGSILSKTTYPTLNSILGATPFADGNLGTPTTVTIIAGTTSNILGLVYENNLYVAAGTGGFLSTSTDAITWTTRTSGTASNIINLIYGDGIYVYVGAGGVLATSTNAITWTARTSGTTSAINGLTYANSLYVYGGVGGVLATSTNAITWTARTSGTTSTINALFYANSLYVYGGANGVLATSTNGVTWTARTSGSITTINTFAVGNGFYIYGAGGVPGIGSGQFGYSVDGVTWSSLTGGSIPGTPNKLVYNSSNLNFYAGLNRLQVSSAKAANYDSTISFKLPVITNSATSNVGVSLYVKAK